MNYHPENARDYSTHNAGFISNSILSNTCATYSAAAAKSAWSLWSQSSELYSSLAFFMISTALGFIFSESLDCVIFSNS
jgi:hypothetical protein